MSGFVVDASVALAWVLPDERSVEALLLREALREAELIAPSVWGLEVINALVIARRRSRLGQAEAAGALDMLLELGVRLETSPDGARLREIERLASAHGMSAYDAAYVEAALRTGATLVSLDERALRGASAAGAAVLRS